MLVIKRLMGRFMEPHSAHARSPLHARITLLAGITSSSVVIPGNAALLARPHLPL